MASNNEKVIPLHRGVRPIPAQDLQRIFDPRPDLHDSFAEHIQRDDYSPPSLLDRAADFFSTPFGLGFYIGVIAGSLGTVAMAFVWGLFL